MCFSGGGRDERKISQLEPGRVSRSRAGSIPDFSTGSPLFKFVKANGGLSTFGLPTGGNASGPFDTDAFLSVLRKAQSAFDESGAFTDRAEVPGAPAPSANFAGARIDRNQTKVSDLKFLPKIPTPSSN